MEGRKDYYAILGITDEEKKLSDNEFQSVLKKKYRKLSLEHHPDKFSDKSVEERKLHEDKFKEIVEAYDVLSDKEKRQRYDLGPMAGNPFMGGDPFNPFTGGFNPFDPFGMSGGRSSANTRVFKGEPIKIRVKVTLEDVYSGVTKKVRFKRKVECPNCRYDECPTCHGTGKKVIYRNTMFMQSQVITDCDECNGTGYKRVGHCSYCDDKGYTEVEVTEDITIPKGVEDGMAIQIEGMGNAPIGVSHLDGYTMAGPLIVMFNVIQHQDYERQGNNLIYNLKLSIYEALTGCKKRVPVINGNEVDVTIPELTEDGKMFCVKGMGLPSVQANEMLSSPNGNMYVRVKYKVPKKSLNKQQRKLLEEFCNEIEG